MVGKQLRSPLPFKWFESLLSMGARCPRGGQQLKLRSSPSSSRLCIWCLFLTRTDTSGNIINADAVRSPKDVVIEAAKGKSHDLVPSSRTLAVLVSSKLAPQQPPSAAPKPNSGQSDPHQQSSRAVQGKQSSKVACLQEENAKLKKSVQQWKKKSD